MSDPIREEAFFADDADIDQPALNASRQEILAQSSQCRRIRAAEKIRSNRQIELIDQTQFQHSNGNWSKRDRTTS